MIFPGFPGVLLIFPGFPGRVGTLVWLNTAAPFLKPEINYNKLANGLNLNFASGNLNHSFEFSRLSSCRIN